MKPLTIEGTNVSPKVLFEPETKSLEISGYSRPENVRDFYFPLIQWIDEFDSFLANAKQLSTEIEPISFKFKFIYFNSSSAKFIYDIIIMLNGIQQRGVPLKIYWYFDEDDDELREAGEELSDMANVPFLFVETKKI
ncbi:MAG: DUF1987 domain-containing protein [Tenuifilaceae bacterium]